MITDAKKEIKRETNIITNIVNYSGSEEEFYPKENVNALIYIGNFLIYNDLCEKFVIDFSDTYETFRRVLVAKSNERKKVIKKALNRLDALEKNIKEEYSELWEKGYDDGGKMVKIDKMSIFERVKNLYEGLRYITNDKRKIDSWTNKENYISVKSCYRSFEDLIIILDSSIYSIDSHMVKREYEALLNTLNSFSKCIMYFECAYDHFLDTETISTKELEKVISEVKEDLFNYIFISSKELVRHI